MLPTRVGRLHLAHDRSGIRAAGVAPVDKEETGVPGPPGGLDDAVKDVARPELPHHLLCVGGDQLVRLIIPKGIHKSLGNGHRDIKVGDPPIELGLNELQDIGMINPEDPHIGTPTSPALLDRLGSTVKDAKETDRA